MDCIFCKIINKEIDSKILYEDDVVIAIMDLYPESEGHTLIIPKVHYTDIYDVPDKVLCHMYEIARKLAHNLTDKLGKKSVIFTINYGETQAIKHLHLHVFSEFKEQNQRSTEEIYNIIK